MRSTDQKASAPAVRERVRLGAGNGVYLVVAVDCKKRTVDLISMEGPLYLLEGIPFSALKPVESSE